MRFIFLMIFAICLYTGRSQNFSNLDTVGNHSNTENLYVKFLHGDSLASSFCIVIKKEVKAHVHRTHSEHVTVIEGEGRMKLGDKEFVIKKGDLVFIPKNMVHSVVTTSKIPLKVLSVQAPLFDGSDRVFVEEK